MYRLLPQPKTQHNNGDNETRNSSPSHLPQPEFLKDAIFAAGSFWELEAAFCRTESGVERTAVGYFGGMIAKPNYKHVLEEKTGHTEAVQVTYDRRKTTYKSLCNFFFQNHDPTNKDYLRFGASTHHRSAIFYRTEEEKKQAQESKVEQQMKLNRRIVTKIIPVLTFYLAESRNQKYYLQEHQLRLCECLCLRSAQQFADSYLALKLNGIFSMDKKKAEEKLSSFLSKHHVPDQAKLALVQILSDLQLSNALEQWI
ncbi:peptide methionine sulfoxide reductase-like [Phalaenopsis equestris]|uniref:peptide methionine sulfoxide reductase-like n=1 Tax=Phalaenopsis equestris TaxID=78828 RepID=UPI0009E53DF4|nr:peptide methionine sulfoxide reductase-like [Phalaenopsis equestris]